MFLCDLSGSGVQSMASDVVNELQNLASSGAEAAAASMPANWGSMNQEEKLGTIMEMIVEEQNNEKSVNKNAGGINSIDELIRLLK